MIAAMDIESFARHGFAIVPVFVADHVVAPLRAHALARDGQKAFKPAGVGRGDTRTERRDIRGDRVLWLDETSPSEVERPLVAAIDALRERINALLYLGLWDFEAHYAIYPPGAFYARHRDRFASERPGAPSRIVSFVVYLNEDWNASDGGALRLYVGDDAHVDVTPYGGTLVCFVAERIEHEVLPATRERLALTGWLRNRAVQ